MRKLKKVRLMMMTLLMLISQLMAKLMLVAFSTVIIVNVNLFRLQLICLYIQQIDCFRHTLKTFLFEQYSASSHQKSTLCIADCNESCSLDHLCCSRTQGGSTSWYWADKQVL